MKIWIEKPYGKTMVEILNNAGYEAVNDKTKPLLETYITINIADEFFDSIPESAESAFYLFPQFLRSRPVDAAVSRFAEYKPQN